MYTLTELTPEILQETMSAWDGYLSAEDLPFSPVGYEAFLHHCEERLTNKERYSDTVLFAVMRDSEKFASGVFVATIPMAGKAARMKILSCRTSPALDTRWESSPIPFPERLKKISQVLVTGFLEIYRKSVVDYKCSELKIFGNKQADVDLFMRFLDELARNPETSDDEGEAFSFNLDTHGSWLVLTTEL